MIGDHLQLRPKVESYALQVQSGRGFDLDVSLFERLARARYPCAMLALQHRMPPAVSALVRGMTYPALRDAPGVQGRALLPGVRDRVVFIPHAHGEDTGGGGAADDGSCVASRTNRFEVGMVSAIVKYVLQQQQRGGEGEGGDEGGVGEVVVLTPYVAQLRALR
ncbi:hypothetical protein JKP88DRAFT_141745, partial [Tribonema minus]